MTFAAAKMNDGFGTVLLIKNSLGRCPEWHTVVYQRTQIVRPLSVQSQYRGHPVPARQTASPLVL